MQKIGLVKCSNKNIKYFNIVSKNEIIDTDGLSLNSISSTIVNSFILQTEFIDNINAIRVFLKNTIKLIYSKSIDNSLYVYEKEFFSVEYIYVPNTIDGNLSSQLFIKNKIKPEVFIENINVQTISQDKIILNFYILLNLKVSPSFYFCYIVNNGLFDNVFLGHSDGKNLIQKTFTSDIEYTHIKSLPNGRNIVVVGCSKDKSNIYILDYNANTSKDICINICGHVNNFDFISSDKLILSINENNKDYLYTANLKTNEIKRLNCIEVSQNYTNPYFDISSNILYFLCIISDVICLCSLDANNNFDNLFSFANVEDYVVNLDGEKIVLKIFKDSQYKLYVLHIPSRLLEPINLDFDYEKILKVMFFKKSRFQETILILYSSNGLKYLASYNFKTLESIIIFSNEVINDFIVDISTLDIFISIQKNNFAELIKIENDNRETLLRIPSTIKQICVK